MVAVLELLEAPEVVVSRSDVEETTTKGSGPGGQHRNKVETVVVLKHKSGIVVRCGSERSQHQNKQLAYEILYSKLKRNLDVRFQKQLAQDKKEKMGSGHRAEKVRTYMIKHNLWIDHRNGERKDLKSWMKGKW
jgi:peptide chain release factor 1